MFLVLMERSEGAVSLKNPVKPPGIDPGTVRLVAQRLNHYATPGPNRKEYQEYFLVGKGGRYVGLTTLLPSCARLSRNLGVSTYWNPQGLSRPFTGIAFATLLLLFLTV
jgi:hypothetical protein